MVTPYWKAHGKFAADHGVKVAIEMHPGFVVYNPETMLRLRAIAGPSVGANLDPSHLFWQGIDPIGAVRVLGDAIHYVHAKDTQLYSANMDKTGVLDTKPYTQERDRSWMFRTVGYGHSAEWWSEFISTLRMYGYDNVLSIEHEDSLMSPDEGLTQGRLAAGPVGDQGETRRSLVGLDGSYPHGGDRHRLYGPGAFGSPAPGRACGCGGDCRHQPGQSARRSRRLQCAERHRRLAGRDPRSLHRCGAYHHAQ